MRSTHKKGFREPNKRKKRELSAFDLSYYKYLVSLPLIAAGLPVFANPAGELSTENVIFYREKPPAPQPGDVVFYSDNSPNLSQNTNADSGNVMSVSGNDVVYQDDEFETIFLHTDKGVSENVFIYSNNVMPGIRDIDIMLNDRRVVKQEINFVVDSETNRVVPCFNRSMLNNLGIKTDLYSGWTTGLNEKASGDSPRCESVENIISDSALSYNDAIQLLTIRVPQAALSSDILRMIPPSEWDNGVPSLRLNYDGYVYNSRNRMGDKNSQTNAYFSLGSTATLGAWRFYSYDTFSKYSGENGWDSNHDRAYAVRDIPSLYSRLHIGDIYTYSPSNVLGVLPLRGVTLGTNTHMMADNQFHYAPVIRGIARTNARVIVRQRGNIIYSTMVTPGSFAIDDMYAGQVGADLEVTVEEADGSQQTFTVPYTSLPNMLRPNSTKYSISVGEYRDKNLSDKPVFAVASYEHGFEPITINTSILGAKDYQAAALGAAWNIGDIGAFAIDAAYSRYKNLNNPFYDDSHDGTAIRFLYAKQFDLTDTGLRILGYQYRSENFLELSEFVNLNNNKNGSSASTWTGLYQNGQLQRRRNRLEANINQGLGDYGSLYVTANYDRYYGTSDTSRSISAGYSTNIKNITMSLNYLHSKYGKLPEDSQVSLTFSMPFVWNKTNFSTASYSIMRNADDQFSQAVTVGGAIDQNRFSYSLNVTEDHDARFSENLYLGYNSSYANFSASASHNRYANQYSAGIGGGLLFYEGGVVLSQRLGDTVVIVETPDAAGVNVSYNLNISTDYWGRAVIPYATAYRYNNVQLDLRKAKDDIELMNSAQKIVPSQGATVVAKFDTRVGRRAIVVINPPDGIEIPLAAPVYGETKRGKEEFGMVGHNGEAYLTGLDATKAQKLYVKLADSVKAQCQFTLPALTKDQQKNPAYAWHTKVYVNCQ